VSVLEPCVQIGESLKGELTLRAAIWHICMRSLLTGAGRRVGGRVRDVDAVVACPFDALFAALFQHIYCNMHRPTVTKGERLGPQRASGVSLVQGVQGVQGFEYAYIQG
jgi:hypothetical protein